MYENKDNSCELDILTDISVYIYRFTYRYTIHNYTQLVLMNCTSVYTTYINGTHTLSHTRTFHFIYIDSSTDIVYYCTHLVQMDCTLLYNLTLPKHTLVVHTLCSDQLNCCTFILQFILCTVQLYTY
jgi:hypothetical protein